MANETETLQADLREAAKKTLEALEAEFQKAK